MRPSVPRPPVALEPPENVQIAVARASAVSHARDVDVCPVRLEVLLHLSLGTGGRGARPRPCHRQNHIFSALKPMEPLREYEKTCKHHRGVPPGSGRRGRDGGQGVARAALTRFAGQDSRAPETRDGSGRVGGAARRVFWRRHTIGSALSVGARSRLGCASTAPIQANSTSNRPSSSATTSATGRRSAFAAHGAIGSSSRGSM